MRWTKGWSARPVDPWEELGPERMVHWDRDIAGPYGAHMAELQNLTIFRYEDDHRVHVVLSGVSASARYWHVAMYDDEQAVWTTTMDGVTRR